MTHTSIAPGTFVNGSSSRTETASLKLRILLAEDDEEFRKLVASVLEQDGHEVVQLADGQSLLQYISMSMFDEKVVGPIDMVITDVRMPGWSGLEVITSARASGCSLPFIIITAFGDEAIHRQAGKLNVVATLDKPFDMETLRQTVRRAEASHRLAFVDPSRRRRLRALVMLDDAELLSAVSPVLAHDGFDIWDCGNARGLLDYLHAQLDTGAAPIPFDVVLTDYPMTDGPGLRATEELRRRGWDVPLIAVTEESDASVREDARARGVTALLGRPVAIEDLRTILLNLSLWRLARMYSHRHRS